VLYVYGKVCVAILSEVSFSFLFDGRGDGSRSARSPWRHENNNRAAGENQYVLNFLDHEQTVKLHHRAHRDGISSVATIGKTTWLGCAEETRTCRSST